MAAVETTAWVDAEMYRDGAGSGCWVKVRPRLWCSRR